MENLTYFEQVVARALHSTRPLSEMALRGWESTVEAVAEALANERELFDRGEFMAIASDG